MAFDDPLWIQSDGTAPVYSAREDRILLSVLFNEGVIRGLKPKQRVAGAQMRVQLEDGDFAIQGDDSSSPPQGMYIGRWTDDAVDANMFIITAAPGSGSRRDLLYIRVNDPNHGGPAGRNFTLGVVAGTPHATTPVLPAVPTSAIAVGEVLVATGTTSITTAMITDLRAVGGLKSELPIGTVLDYSGPEASIASFYPNYVPADGRAINRLTYFGYMRHVGTAHGSGDGSTTVNVADYRGRVGVGLDNMGTVDAGRLAGVNTLGASGGTETFTMIEGNLPPHSHSMQGHTHDAGHNHAASEAFESSLGGPRRAVGNYSAGGGAVRFQVPVIGNVSNDLEIVYITIPHRALTTGGPSSANTGNGNGTSTAISRMQPYILVNKIVKVA